MASTDPIIYRDDSGVMITASRAVLGATTYSVANITSVSVRRGKSHGGTKALLIIIGLLFFSGGITAPASVGSTIFGITLAAWSGVWIWKFPPKCFVHIASASGEVNAIESRSIDYIARVVRALNDAMSQR